MGKYKWLYCLVATIAFAANAYATPSNSISIPHSFSPNTTIESSKVNSNNNEVQSKFNAHTHTDITQVGTITTGTWNSTAVSTQYGGTGQNWSSKGQGGIPFFNATGTMDVLPYGATGYVLQTNGLNNNPNWILPGTGAKDAITRGFEASASVGKTAVTIYAGTLFHNTTQVNVATTTTLTLSTAGHWSSGSTVSYAGGAGWNYIGVQASDLNGHVKFLGSAAPTASDTSGNASGNKLYSYDGTRWWRVIGAIRVNTSDQSALGQRQQNNIITLDESVDITTTDTNQTWSAATSCSAGVPAISTYVKFWGSTNGGSGNTSRLFIIPNGGVKNLVSCGWDLQWANYNNNSVNAGNLFSPTDESQQIQYYSYASSAFDLNVSGYTLNIR